MIPLGIIGSALLLPQIFTKFKVEYTENETNKKIIEDTKVIKSKHFRPSPLFPFGMMHTLLGRYFDKSYPMTCFDKKFYNVEKKGHMLV